MTEITNIESDPNPFSKMDILPGIGWVKRIGGMMISHIYFFRDEEPNRGAAPLLDRALYEKQLGHAVAVGQISAEEAYDWDERINWVERATYFPNE